MREPINFRVPPGLKDRLRHLAARTGRRPFTLAAELLGRAVEMAELVAQREALKTCDVHEEGKRCGRPSIARVHGQTDGPAPEIWERQLCRTHSEHARIFAGALDVAWEPIP